MSIWWKRQLADSFNPPSADIMDQFGPEDRERMVTRPLRFPEFSGIAPCAKCGTAGAETRHEPAQPPFYVVDWLLRVCHVCGYRWEERCLNPTRVEAEDV